MKDLTKELHYSPSDATTIAAVKELFEELLAQTWTIDIYRGGTPKTFNLKELGWTIGFNNAKRSAGICGWKRRRTGMGGISTTEIHSKKVELSMHLLSQNLEEGKASEWEETIRHELAHAVDVEMRNKSNHDNTWKAVARAMLSTGARTFTSDDLKDEKQSKYTLVCPKCKKEKKSHKKKKKASACGACCRAYNNGRYSTEYILVQIKNY